MMFMNVEDVTCVSCGWFSMFNVSTGDVYECFKEICRDFMWDFMWDLNGTWHIWMEIFMKYHWDTNGISLNTLWYLFSKLENAPVLGKTSNSMGHGFHSYVRLQEGYVCSFLTFLKIYIFFLMEQLMNFHDFYESKTRISKTLVFSTWLTVCTLQSTIIHFQVTKVYSTRYEASK